LFLAAESMDSFRAYRVVERHLGDSPKAAVVLARKGDKFMSFARR
jgi:hypothetical protein